MISLKLLFSLVPYAMVTAVLLYLIHIERRVRALKNQRRRMHLAKRPYHMIKESA